MSHLHTLFTQMPVLLCYNLHWLHRRGNNKARHHSYLDCVKICNIGWTMANYINLVGSIFGFSCYTLSISLAKANLKSALCSFIRRIDGTFLSVICLSVSRVTQLSGWLCCCETCCPLPQWDKTAQVSFSFCTETFSSLYQDKKCQKEWEASFHLWHLKYRLFTWLNIVQTNSHPQIS